MDAAREIPVQLGQVVNWDFLGQYKLTGQVNQKSNADLYESEKTK